MPRKKSTDSDKELNIEKKSKSRSTVSSKANAKNKYSALSEFDSKAKTSKKATVSSSKSTSKKSSVRKKTTVGSKAKSKSSKESVLTAKAESSLKKVNSTDSESLVSTKFDNVVEYYDLPYRYNHTVVKVLAQNPNTLFVYWDVSDKDVENFQKMYGENFLSITRPVLLVHNISENYTFEIDVNDFANNWYINVSDSKCEYSIELCRRPTQSAYIENKITNEPIDLINISFSNTIELPNDKILFFKDGDEIIFKNIKTNKIYRSSYKSTEHSKKLKEIYSNYNVAENGGRFDFQNPSSQNPTSNVM